MSSVLQIPAATTLRRIHRIQAVTIAWMGVEAVVSLWAHGWRAVQLCWHSEGTAPSNCSRVVVLWRSRVRGSAEHIERRTARIAGTLLFALAVYVAVASALP